MKLFKLFESYELGSELIKLQRYITDNNLETQMEIEGYKIVFRAGDKLIEWGATEAHRIRTKVLTDAWQSYEYAKHVIDGQFELGEPIIATKTGYSFYYAKNVINGRWEPGEIAISKDAGYSVWYSRDVIKGRFELGEPAIAKDAEYSTQYQKFLNQLKS